MRLLLGGSPCTHWSIAQTKNRETEPSGLGWELFKNYLIAREKYKPDYFLYENNKSMANAIREQITKELGVPPVLINSALVSAQNRQRLYWAGKRMPDGSYAPLDIQQPEDRGILLRDILETVTSEKGYALKPKTAEVLNVNPSGHGMNGTVIHAEGKSRTLTTNKGEGQKIIVPAEIKCVASRGRYTGAGGSVEQHFEAREDEKTNTLTTVQKDNYVAVQIGTASQSECINPTPNGKSRTVDAHMKNLEHCLVPRVNNPNPAKQQYDCIVEPVRIGTIDSDTKHPEHDSQQYRVYSPDGKSVTLCGAGGVLEQRPDCMQSGSAPAMRVREATKRGYADILPGECVDLSMPNSKTRRGRSMKNKSNCLTTSCEYYEYCGTLDMPVYQVKDGYITIKDKQYPIKLRDGCYIIRKLTVTECKRLQTVPDSYVFPVSDSQAYKMLGNGWTVEVIAHILSHIPEIRTEPLEVLSMYDGMSCGHIALDRLGAEVATYYATEIDKYAIQTTQHNYPDTVQLGDAFQVREDGWRLPEVENDCSE